MTGSSGAEKTRHHARGMNDFESQFTARDVERGISKAIMEKLKQYNYNNIAIYYLYGIKISNLTAAVIRPRLNNHSCDHQLPSACVRNAAAGKYNIHRVQGSVPPDDRSGRSARETRYGRQTWVKHLGRRRSGVRREFLFSSAHFSGERTSMNDACRRGVKSIRCRRRLSAAT